MLKLRDEVEVDHRLEALEVVRTALGHRPLGDAAAGGGHHDVQPAQLVDGRLQRFLGPGEVGDVDRIERAADALGDLLAVGALAVEHRDLRATLVRAARR